MHKKKRNLDKVHIYRLERWMFRCYVELMEPSKEKKSSSLHFPHPLHLTFSTGVLRGDTEVFSTFFSAFAAELGAGEASLASLETWNKAEVMGTMEDIHTGFVEFAPKTHVYDLRILQRRTLHYLKLTACTCKGSILLFWWLLYLLQGLWLNVSETKVHTFWELNGSKCLVRILDVLKNIQKRLLSSFFSHLRKLISSNPVT